MADKEFLVDLSQVDFDRPIASLDEIRKYNPQRFEMEQLTAVVYANEADYSCVGYKDTSEKDIWVRGHMPGMPLMPGVIMLESIAQLCSYVTQRYDLLGAEMVGFGGLESVRFRDPVVPGDRLIVMCRLEKVRRGRMIVCKFQGVVKDRIVVEGTLKGIPIPVESLQQLRAQASERGMHAGERVSVGERAAVGERGAPSEAQEAPSEAREASAP